MEKDNVTPGSRFASGRPATGRTHSITIRLSAAAYDILKDQKNKSAYIDKLIQKEGQNSKTD